MLKIQNDNEVQVPKNERVWVIVGPIAVCVTSTDEGVVVDFYPAGDEMRDPVHSTYVFDSDVEGGE